LRVVFVFGQTGHKKSLKQSDLGRCQADAIARDHGLQHVVGQHLEVRAELPDRFRFLPQAGVTRQVDLSDRHTQPTTLSPIATVSIDRTKARHHTTPQIISDVFIFSKSFTAPAVVLHNFSTIT
jgi:hypothetical protein